MIKTRNELFHLIQNVNVNTFDDVAMEIFRYQVKNNQIFSDYVQNVTRGKKLEDINNPIFLPISAYKHHEVKSGEWGAEKTFYSSSTTNQGVSKHLVKDLNGYLQSCRLCWEQFYGPVSDYKFLCLLPGYLEREGSSLVIMLDHFVNELSHGGFYLYNHDQLYEELVKLKEEQKKTVLFGVSYALLDFLDSYQIDFPDLIVMETGGMKGTRRELLKSEFHHILKRGFGVSEIHSEYGMTELFSQAYSKGDELFYPSKTMQVRAQQITDPFTQEKNGKTGVVQIIDLNNIDTCSFIQTQDLGIVHSNGSFQLMGRLDEADIRGCNLMVV